MSISNINWQTFGEKFFAYVNELAKFNFSVSNPVFWLFFCVLFLLLLKLWDIRKAFSFCVVVALILFVATKAQAHASRFFSQAGESFDGVLIKIATMVLIAIVILYYSCIKSNY